jgi:subtilisin family serine protease
LFAPGVNIYSALNTDDTAMGLASGTSMAAPHVAGAAALYLQAHPSATPAEVASAILGDATRGALIITQGSSNLLLHVNGSGGTVVTPPPIVQLPTNAPPIASFSSSCQKANCTFDGSTSRDDGGITSYEWNFGDGASSVSAASPFSAHSYTRRGTYSVTVTLTVRDAIGATASVARTIQIKNGGK